MRNLLLILFLLLFAPFAHSQTAAFWLEGTVHGYTQDPSKGGILKKTKQALLEGTLEETKLHFYLNDKLVQEVESDEKGSYSVSLQFNKLYTLTISKAGYNTMNLLLDTRAFPARVQKGGFRFTGLEFMLNHFRNGKDKSLDRNLGRVYFNPSQQEFTLIKHPRAEAPSPDAPLELLERALAKNNERFAHYQPLISRKEKSRAPIAPATKAPPAPPSTLYYDSLLREQTKHTRLTISSGLDLAPLHFNGKHDTSSIRYKQAAIAKAREQLAMDKLRQQTKFDSLEILKREALIKAAEHEIVSARLLIHTQQEKLLAQRNSLVLLILLLVLVLGFLFLVFTFFKNKQQSNQLLEQKNKQITDSISYAQRIQQSILIGERALKKYLPDSFVISEPRDIVSGDFYFFHPHAQGFVIAVADCTGHGVPGAFMSLIGYRLLREIIAEKGVTDPAQILELLDAGIQQALQGEKEGDIVQDGMDISVCLVNPSHRTLTFAAAMNPAYLICNADVKVLPADIVSVGGKVLRGSRKREFTNKVISYASGDMLYLFSDGYMDQFGMELDQKFNTKRFKEMLLSIQSYPAGKQKETAYQTLHHWKGAVRQTDDILLMGIRLP